MSRHPNIELFALISLGAILGAVAYHHYLRLNQPSELSEIGSESLEEVDEMLGVETFDLMHPTLVLRALRSGEIECAYCLLESNLDRDVRELDRLLLEASEGAQSFAKGELDFAREYLAEHPYDGLACEGQCKKFAGVE